jgi:hypothetical protein
VSQVPVLPDPVMEVNDRAAASGPAALDFAHSLVNRNDSDLDVEKFEKLFPDNVNKKANRHKPYGPKMHHSHGYEDSIQHHDIPNDVTLTEPSWK